MKEWLVPPLHVCRDSTGWQQLSSFRRGRGCCWGRGRGTDHLSWFMKKSHQILSTINKQKESNALWLWKFMTGKIGALEFVLTVFCIENEFSRLHCDRESIWWMSFPRAALAFLKRQCLFCLLLFSFSAMADTGSRSFACALVSVITGMMERYKEPLARGNNYTFFPYIFLPIWMNTIVIIWYFVGIWIYCSSFNLHELFGIL